MIRQTIAIGFLTTAITSMAFAAPPQSNRPRHINRPRDMGLPQNRGKNQADVDETAGPRRHITRGNRPGETPANRNRDNLIDPASALRINPASHLRPCSAVDRPWEVHADTDKDGKVSRSELHAYHLGKLDSDHNGVITLDERKAHWIHNHAVVRSPSEKRYDTNGDGYLNWEEGREYLKDRIRVINTEGRAIVNNDIELEFDVDKDGVIDRAEAANIKAVLEAR